jgi:salicylate hydroxylase
MALAWRFDAALPADQSTGSKRLKMKVVILGGGIAGLATARALSRSGIDNYVVVEQASQLTEIGAGIQLTNNATRVLDYLGLLDEFRKSENHSQGSTYRDLISDDVIFDTPAGEYAEKRYGTPYVQVYRRRFVDILKNSVDPEKIRLSSRCVRIKDEEDGITVQLENGDLIQGDVVIGADGIHSIARTLLLPPTAPEFSGLLGWRALIPAARVQGLDLDRWHYQWWGPNRSITSYWVNGGERGKLLNFLGVVPSEEVSSESWKTEGDVRKLQASFKGACDRVLGIVSQIDQTFITGIFDRPPLGHYAKGRVALIGDAAHPVWPFLANGAAQALEDSVVIARCLARADAKRAPAALLDYEQRRLPRANYIQRRSRMMMEPSHLSDPDEIASRNKRIRTQAAADPMGAWTRDWLWGYDAVAAADAPIESVWREPAPFYSQS